MQREESPRKSEVISIGSPLSELQSCVISDEVASESATSLTVPSGSLKMKRIT